MDYFKNRQVAGQLLAEKLMEFKSQSPLVLGIPRGGIPVAFEVAKKLQAPLDLLAVKKIGSPTNLELAIGAVSEDGKPWLNKQIIHYLRIGAEELQRIVKLKTDEVKKQSLRLRGSSQGIDVEGKTLIIVDDGIATGATLSAAIALLRSRKAKQIIVATPVAPESTLQLIAKVADRVVCLHAPEYFNAVGDWYDDFTQVSDDEVIEMLRSKKHLPPLKESDL